MYVTNIGSYQVSRENGKNHACDVIFIILFRSTALEREKRLMKINSTFVVFRNQVIAQRKRKPNTKIKKNSLILATRRKMEDKERKKKKRHGK